MNIREHFKQNKLPFIMSPILVIVFFYVRKLFIDNIDKEQYYQHSFSDYGTFMAGTVGVVLTALNLYYLLHIWKQQKSEFEKQSNEQKARFEQDRSERKEMFDQEQNEQKARFEQERIEQNTIFETQIAEQKEQFKKEQDAQNLKFEQQRIEERFFNLLEMRKEMRDEITYKTPNGSSLKSNEAIHEIAAEFSSKINKQYKHESEQIACLKKMYEYYGRYLRHYFDLILNTIEYIIGHKTLTDDQKREYIKLLKASTSYNEALIWHLMKYDYEVMEKNPRDVAGIRFMEITRQDLRFEKYNREYELSDGKVIERITEL